MVASHVKWSHPQHQIGRISKDKMARDKGINARTLKGKILNVDFLLCLSGLVDIYEQFGVIVQVT